VKPRVDRIQIEYQLDFAMPFHFGTGMRVGLIDQAAQEAPTYSLLLLLAGLLMVEHMGANKSSGKGKCSFKITQLTLGDTSYAESEWQSWMDQLELLALYTEE
jgi:hypothetical protein